MIIRMKARLRSLTIIYVCTYIYVCVCRCIHISILSLTVNELHTHTHTCPSLSLTTSHTHELRAQQRVLKHAEAAATAATASAAAAAGVGVLVGLFKGRGVRQGGDRGARSRRASGVGRERVIGKDVGEEEEEEEEIQRPVGSRFCSHSESRLLFRINFRLYTPLSHGGDCGSTWWDLLGRAGCGERGGETRREGAGSIARQLYPEN